MMPNTELTPADIAFPAKVSHLMPDRDEIPEEFKNLNGNHWALRFQNDWFFWGLKEWDIPWREDIDGTAALKHLKCIQGSFEPKHEHKVAAVAYLLDLWTDGEATWTRGEK